MSANFQISVVEEKFDSNGVLNAFCPGIIPVMKKAPSKTDIKITRKFSRIFFEQEEMKKLRRIALQIELNDTKFMVEVDSNVENI